MLPLPTRTPGFARGSLPSAIAAAAVLVLGVTGCSSDDGEGSKPAPSASSEGGARASVAAVEHLDPKAFAARIAQPGVVVLDVRTPQEYAEGHLANAKNIDIQASDFGQRIAALDKSGGYAVYCRSGKRSNTAATQLLDSGFTKVADLAGGIIAWTSAGNQVTTS